MKEETLTIRISKQRKNKLQLYAAQKDKTVTALIDDWIDTLQLRDERREKMDN
ncbi:MAG: hypothetical protein AB1589_32805 [Cyanobacteriota bacterium]